MKGTFAEGKKYAIKKKTADSKYRKIFTWTGGCTEIDVGNSSFEYVMKDYSVEDSDSNASLHIEDRFGKVVDNDDTKKSINGNTGSIAFHFRAQIPHGPSFYNEMYDDCTEVCSLSVPKGKRLIVRKILYVNLETNEYELPDNYIVEEIKE